MKKLYLLCLITISFLFIGCSDGEDNNDTVTQGWHFQGRDCLACHNTDLSVDKNLLIGATLFKSSNVTDVDDLNQSCGGEFVVNFLDTSYATQISSVDYEDLDSSGYQGKGNIFILSRKLDTLNDNYYVQIVDKKTNKVMALSGTHNFNASDYNINNPVDYSNRLSCNTCHNGSTVSYIYPQVNQDLCE